MPARTVQKKKKTTSPGLSSLVLEKVPTGIRGLDQVTHGGFPKGRTALVCGGPGTGKTLLGLEFLVRGALLYNEPGVCVAMEETAQELVTNMASLGYDLPALIRQKNWPSTMSILSASRLKKPANTILKACSSACARPLSRSRPSACSWIPSNCSSSA